MRPKSIKKRDTINPSDSKQIEDMGNLPIPASSTPLITSKIEDPRKAFTAFGLFFFWAKLTNLTNRISPVIATRVKWATSKDISINFILKL